MYSTVNSYEAPVQGKSMMGAVVGAGIGAVVGAIVLAAVTAVDRAVYAPTNLYTAAAVRPAMAVGAAVPVNAAAQSRAAASAAFAVNQPSGVESEAVIMQASQGINVQAWTWVAFAAIAGAVNGLFLWRSNRVAMAATTGRREALMAGVTAASMAAAPAFAAYGDAANVFGKKKDAEQFFTISGDGFTGIMPGKYNVSREREIPGMVGRWEDNFDAVNAAYVIVRPTTANSITDLGGLDKVRADLVTPLLGQQAFDGQSISEGGFAPGRYAAAAILDQKEEVKNGKTYYTYELLTRTADGNEGGRHQLFSIAANNGKLYIFKTQAGDKRWFKGLERPLRASLDAFTVL